MVTTYLGLRCAAVINPEQNDRSRWKSREQRPIDSLPTINPAENFSLRDREARAIRPFDYSRRLFESPHYSWNFE